MANVSKTLTRQRVNQYGLAHTSAFDIRIEGLSAPFDDWMPAVAKTTDRDQQEDVAGVPGLPGTTSTTFGARSIQLTVHDTANRDLEKAMLDWRARRSHGLNKAAPPHFESRLVTIEERFVVPVSGGVQETDSRLFTLPSLRDAASSVIDRVTGSASDRVSLELAQATADLEATFFSSYTNVSLTDVLTVPTTRRRLLGLLDSTAGYKIKSNKVKYHCIPTDAISSSADFTGRGGLSQLDISFRIVGVLKTS